MKCGVIALHYGHQSSMLHWALDAGGKFSPVQDTAVASSAGCKCGPIQRYRIFVCVTTRTCPFTYSSSQLFYPFVSNNFCMPSPDAWFKFCEASSLKFTTGSFEDEENIAVIKR